MVFGNFIVEVVISLGPKDPSVVTDRVEDALGDADPLGPPKKTTQVKILTWIPGVRKGIRQIDDPWLPRNY